MEGKCLDLPIFLYNLHVFIHSAITVYSSSGDRNARRVEFNFYFYFTLGSFDESQSILVWDDSGNFHFLFLLNAFNID
jgi:hypothetical protein